MIVGLTGRKGVGKDTVAHRLAALMPGWQVHNASFSLPLREAAAISLGVPVSLLDELKYEPEAKITVRLTEKVVLETTVRRYLQHMGDAFRGAFGLDFLPDLVLPLDGDYDDDRLVYVATSVRTEREAARVRELGGVLVRVVGPSEDEGDTHETERLLDVEHEIDNTVRDDDFAHLDEQIGNLLAEMEVPW